MKEVRIVTEIRGLAALIVMLFHFVCVSNNFLQTQWLVDFFYVGKYGVQMFFVISGFVLTFSLLNSNYKTSNFFLFILKRIIRIEPPFIAALIIILLFFYLKSYILNIPTDHFFSGKQVLLHLGYLIPFSHYSWLSIVFWTLAIEFQFYLLISVVFPLLRYSFLTLILSLVAMSLLFFVNRLFPSIALFFWLPIFVSGIALAFINSNQIQQFNWNFFKHKNTCIICLVLFIDIFIFIYHGLSTLAIVFVTQILIYKKIPFNSKFLYFIGKISYSLYLTHTIVGFFLINIVIEFTDLFVVRCCAFLLILTITISFAYFFNMIFERPFQNLASKIKYKNRSKLLNSQP